MSAAPSVSMGTIRWEGSLERLAAIIEALLLIAGEGLHPTIGNGALVVDRARCGVVLADLRLQGVEAPQQEIDQAALEILTEIGVVRA